MSSPINTSSSNIIIQGSSNFDANKFYEIELQKLFDAMMSIQTLRTQVGIFFGTANLAALSIAFSNQKTVLVFFSSLLLGAFLITDLVLINVLKRLYFRATQVQERFAPNDEQTYLTIVLPYYWKKAFENIRQKPANYERDKAINRLFLSGRVVAGFWFPLMGGLVEIVAAVILGVAYNWKFV